VGSDEAVSDGVMGGRAREITGAMQVAPPMIVFSGADHPGFRHADG
jgi:hypothetical protein